MKLIQKIDFFLKFRHVHFLSHLKAKVYFEKTKIKTKNNNEMVTFDIFVSLKSIQIAYKVENVTSVTPALRT